MDSRLFRRLRRGRQRSLSATAAAVLLLLGATALVVGLLRQQPAPPVAHPAQEPARRSAPPSAAGNSSSPHHDERPAVMAASAPTRLSIPAIGVDTSLERLALDAHRAMQTPKDPARVGWYTPGPTPGARGPAVIAGHVTWNETKAVFFQLARLKAGDHVYVHRKDGSTARFTVSRTEQYAKKDFPSIDVYGNVDYAALRLITCAGTYSGHSYADNTVVYARLDPES
ncbi:class F sortase (plasmid) [Streptomyces sp. Q6]|uniref:Class F sortase n=1 Tax=Streptomyces citrinus TaxID=3118173 RepID=A0ACD5AQ56_9ACTN